MVRFIQHDSHEYAPRTFLNIAKSDATVAIAIDFATAGEQLTKDACSRLRKPILQLLFHADVKQSVRDVLKFLKEHNPKVINLAGNGIYTMHRHGITQGEVNIVCHKILSQVHDEHRIYKLVSGGQTGVDFSAGVVGRVLGIDCDMTLPSKFRQRDELGIDIVQTNIQLRHKLVLQTKQLKKHLNN